MFFTHSETSAIVEQHREKGHRAVYVSQESLWLAEGASARMLCPLNEVALPLQGIFSFHLESVLAAVGACWALGMEDGMIAEGLRNFGGSGVDAAPGQVMAAEVA